MYIVFEDAGFNLSKDFFSVVYGLDKLKYAEGNKNVIRKINEIIDYKEIIAYVDVIPDNPYTLEVFTGIYDCFKSSKNIYVIPYFCYEYSVLNYLIDFEGLILKNDELSALKHNVSYKTLNGFKNTRSFEGFCKGLYHAYLRNYPNLKRQKKQGACFVSKYTAYLENKIMLKYFKSKNISEQDAVRLFLKDFDKAISTLGVNLSKNKDYLYMKGI